MSLRRQAFSGVRWTAFSSLTRMLLQVANVTILARLLLPADFGLIAVVSALMAFIQVFADVGISNAIIHYQEISKAELSSLYWLNVGMSVLLAVMVIAVSPVISGWYHEDVLCGLLILAAITLVINSLGQQIRVTAQKSLRFSSLTVVELVSAALGFFVAVAFAWLGAGVFAIAIGGLAEAISGFVLAWMLLAQGWRPMWHLRVDEVRRFLKFGGYMIGNNLATTFNNQIDVLLGARLFSAGAMGVYSVPKNLTLKIQMMVNPIVTNVGLPVMARTQQDKALLKSIYLQILRMLASVNCPIYVAIAVFAPEIVSLMLGEKWESSTGPMLRLFACWALLRSVGSPVGSLMFANGKVNLAFKWNFGLLFFIGPIAWAGAQFGLQGMAIGMVLLMIGLSVPMWYLFVRPITGIFFHEYIGQIAIPLLLSLVAGLCGYYSAAPFDFAVTRLPLGLTVGGLIYCFGSWWFNRVWVNAIFDLVFVRM